MEVEVPEFHFLGILKAETATGDIHMRPLTSPSDILLAIQELLDAKVFRQGCVQLLQGLPAPVSKCFYRCSHFTDSDQMVWEKLRY